MYKNHTTLPVSQTELYRVNAQSLFLFPHASKKKGSKRSLRIHLFVSPVKVQEDV
jgi:hypothetical protein